MSSQTRKRAAFKLQLIAIMVLLLFNPSERSIPIVLAQSATTSLSGLVIDQSDAIVRGAEVRLLNPSTGFQREAKTNAEGIFAFHFLPPGDYQVAVAQEGFATIVIENLTLNVNDPRAIRIRLKVGGLNETLIIKADAGLRDTSAVSTVIDRQFVANLPVNGQNFLPLIALTPGVVPTAASSVASGWGYSVNGQRPTSNYLTIDGVSANIAAGNSLSPGPAMIGALPGLTVFGGLNDLVSIDALQEFKILSSVSPPEFGRAIGGQISIVTRSGTNGFHATVFDYLRNEALDANDWFANRSGLKKPPLRQNDFGGVLGGPLLLPRFDDGAPRLYNSRRLFFFLSYEGMRVRQPQVAVTELPSIGLRQRAATQIKPLLDAFPIPNGPEDPKTGLAAFTAGYSNPSELNAASIRIDHTVNDRLLLFGRYNYAPSVNTTRSSKSPSVISRTILNTRTLTLGGTLSLRPKLANDFRFNYSRTEYHDSFSLDAFSGAIPLADSRVFPSFASRADSQMVYALFLNRSLDFPRGTDAAIAPVRKMEDLQPQTGQALSISASPELDLSLLDAAIQVGKNVRYLQRQLNLVDTFSVATGRHQLKFGIDYRRMSPKYEPPVYTQGSVFTDATALETGRASAVYLNARDEAEPLFRNFSAFWQDSWRAGRRLTLNYGVRWEVNPSPSAASGDLPYTVIGLDDPATMRLAPRNSRLWRTKYHNFAPRFGLAYQISQSRNRETILRGGIGIFYDLGPGYAVAGYEGLPFSRSELLMDVPFPVEPALATPPPPAEIQPPYRSLTVVDPELKLPYTLQWNLAVEQSIGSNQTVSATYAAAMGRRLMNGQTANIPNPDFQLINTITNNARSDYQALQFQFQRRLSRGLQAIASYSWSHSIDIVSDENQWNSGLYKGDSDFDVRHLFSGAITYDLPGPHLHGWSFDSIIRAQSALPVNVVDLAGSSLILMRTYEFLRPNLIPGVPPYLMDATAPGGKRINPAAFAPPFSSIIPNDGRSQGTLGRNALRGFPFYQIDVSLRRMFTLTEKISLQFKADIFNILNHPNFSNPEAVLYSGYVGLLLPPTTIPNPTFGFSQSMVGRGGESTGIIGGLNSLYQAGGPRSIQFSLKLQF
jgi:carboxypeptidase family protein/TonB-dependent receptor-like protein